MNKKLLILLFCSFFLLSSPIDTFAKSTPYLDLEKATISKQTVLDNKMKYPIHFQSNNLWLVPTSKSVWIEKNYYRKGKNSLGYKLNSNEQRIETMIADIPNNKTKFIKFSVFFPKNYQIPEDWNIFAQWWQGSPASPPISFEIVPQTTDFKMRIVTRDGKTKNFNTRILYNDKIERNKWIDLVVELKVDDTGKSNGVLRVWKNNKQILNYKGKLGYTDLNKHTNFRFGIYRSKVNKSIEKIYFDEIKIENNKR